MKTRYFQGLDGYVWWNGVVEDRKDPLFLGRCRVRILGWHTENKTQLPTSDLPWAFPLMPITSASQTGVGQAPVGPVEGTWVMGFYRDGELAQEPVMVGTLPGIPERFAKQNTGFYDPRLDENDRNKNSIDPTTKRAKTTGTTKNLQSYPFPPKSVSYKAGREAIITDYTHDERIVLSSQSLYPRELDKPTTSIYARGESDSTSNVLSDSNSIVQRKLQNVLSDKLTVSYTPNKIVTQTLRNGDSYFTDSTSFNSTNVIKDIKQPSTPYASVYPFNHVYESESGHLVEIDDTPTKERLHWYHRSGTFTEFHPAGNRVDRTVGHRYNMTTGNQESIIQGDELKVVTKDAYLDAGGKLTLNSSQDMKLISDSGNVIVDSPTLNTVISGKNVLVAASDTLVLKAGTKIIRDDDSANDVVKGNYELNVQGGYNLSAGKLSLGSMGAMNISTFGPLSHTVTGNSEETIANAEVLFGNRNAKTIRAVLGKIVLETVDAILTGGIQLNVGPAGVAGQIAIKAPLGDIDILSNTGPSGVNIRATTLAKLKGLVGAEVEGTATAKLKSSGLTQIEGGLITVGGTSSPALLAKDFLKIFSEHYHPSSVGPTGPLHPSFASRLISTMSKKVFLS